jgi:hypothetical protein
MQGPVLEYVPQLYRYRYPAGQLILAPVLAVLVGIPILFGLFGSVPLLCLPLATVAIVAAGCFITKEVWGGEWECRIQAGNLSFRRPKDHGWVAVPIQDIQHVFSIFYTNGDRWPEYEIVMADGRRMLLDHHLIGRFPDFKAAVQACNRSVQFGRRDGQLCHVCGEDLRVRRDKCPACDTPIPAQPPPVPRGQA